MRIVQKLSLMIAAIVFTCFTGNVSAQSIEEARQLYNDGGAASTEGDLETAVTKFTACVDMCSQLVKEDEDPDAEELMMTVQQNIPKLYYQLCINKLQEKDVKLGYDYALKAKKAGTTYGDADIVSKASERLTLIYYSFGLGKFKAEKYEEALQEFDKAIAEDANYTKAYYMKAVIYKTTENDEALLEASRKAIEKAVAENDTKTEESTTKMTATYFLKKGNDAKEASKYDEAIKNLNYSIEFNKENADTYFLLTAIYNSKNDWDKAIAAANNGLKYEAATADAKARFYYEIGSAYVGKGDNTSACNAYSKAATGAYLENAKYKIDVELKCNN